MHAISKQFKLHLFTFTTVTFVLCNAQPRSLMNIRTWGYQLQNISIPQIVANRTFDLIVMDYSQDGTGATAFTAQQIGQIQTSGKKALAYISIGEAEDYRDYWQSIWKTNPPAWLGAENPNWKGNYKVRYWMAEWQSIIFQYIDTIIAQGFDGIYMDIIDAYYYWMQENPEKPNADSLMIRFVLNIRNHISSRTARTFYLLPQNAEEIVSSTNVTPALKAQYFSAIDAIGVEDVFFPGNDDENNPFNPTASRITQLQEFLANGKQVFSIEYLTEPAKISQYKTAAMTAKFIPYTCKRDLASLCDGIATAIEEPPHEIEIRLSQNYPNPFSESTTIGYEISDYGLQVTEPRRSAGTANCNLKSVILKFYDLFGREVLDLSEEIQHRSQVTIHHWQLPGSNLYFYRMIIGRRIQTRAMVLQNHLLQ